MKKQLLFFVALILLTGTTLKAQTQQQPISTPVQIAKEDHKGFTLDMGMSLFFLSTSRNLETFGGFVINGGYYTSAHSLLGLELGFVFGGGDEVGWFTYSYNDNPSRIYSDGKATRDYMAIPVLASWNYIFDCTQKFHLKLGPSLGFIPLTAFNSYSPSNIDGLPGSNSKTKTLFAFGAGIGASWDILKRSCITVGYKFIINSGGDFEYMDINPIANQINITWGWRW